MNWLTKISVAAALVWVAAAVRAWTQVGAETLIITAPIILTLALYAIYAHRKEVRRIR